MSTVVEDATLEVMALLESEQLLSDLLPHLTEGSSLFLRLAQVQLRLVWLLKKRPLSSSQVTRLTSQEAYLRRFLGVQVHQAPLHDRLRLV